MSTEVLRDVVTRLNTAAGAVAIIGVAIESRLTATPIDPRLAPHANAVLDALGVKQAFDEAPPAELGALLAPIRALSLLNHKLMLAASGITPGWKHTEEDLLQALGGMTHGLANALRTRFAPMLTGLAQRLASQDAHFLDVGVGVAKLSIDLAVTFPNLRVVGIDPWEPALALARQNIASAGLEQRVEVRPIGGEQLSEVDRFDLAWIASVFMSEDVVPYVAEKVLRALRPGGWALVALSKPHSDDPLADALWDFRIVHFGGSISTPDEGAALLRRVGYVDVAPLPVPPGAVAGLVAGRKRPR
jgi:SAM-dependent methyltransferase